MPAGPNRSGLPPSSDGQDRSALSGQRQNLTALLRLAGHMCDARLWSALNLPFAAWDADLGRGSSVQMMAEDALEAAPPSFIAIGFSMGGIVALHLAPIAGERLKGLILLDTNPGADPPERRLMRERQQRAVAQGLLPQIVREELKPQYLAAGNSERADILDLAMDMALACGPSVFLSQAEALRTRPDVWGVLPTLNLPVLVLCGAEDELCPPALHARICRACPDASLSIVEGAGHLLPLEQPAAVSTAIMAWVEQHFTGDADG